MDKADRQSEVEKALDKARTLVSVDLLAAAKAELRQLEVFEKHPELLNEEVVSNAIRRYETCWLPMKVCTPKIIPKAFNTSIFWLKNSV